MDTTVTNKNIIANVERPGACLIAEMDEKSMLDTILMHMRSGATVTLDIKEGDKVTFTTK